MKAAHVFEPSELPSFLRVLRLDWNAAHPTAPWLVNDFYDNFWVIRTTDDARVRLSWHRMMASGVCLTSDGYQSRSDTSLPTEPPPIGLLCKYNIERDYRTALNRLKRIVFFYRHPRITRRCGATHFCQLFQWMMTLTEWVFLYEERFQPRLHLFERVDSVDLDHEFLFKWAAGGKAELLNLEARLREALRHVLTSIDNNLQLGDQVAATLADLPLLASHSEEALPWLMFSPEQTTRLRAWLQTKNYYRAKGASRGRLSIQPLFHDLVHQDVKADTLPPSLLLRLGTLNQPDSPQQTGRSSRHSRERPSVTVDRLDRPDPARISSLRMEFVDSARLYVRKLKVMSTRCEAGLPPASVWSHVTFQPTLSLNLEPKGSTPTMPPEIAMHCLGMAVGFVLAYGDDLVTYAIKVKKRLHAEQVRRQPLGVADHVSYLDNLPRLSLRAGIPKSLRPLNIGQIHSIFRTRSEPAFGDDGGKVVAGSIRKHMGLLDALHLLEACTIVIVGTTAARRQIELRTLEDDCLAKVMDTGWYLKFALGKDVFGSVHGQMVRCIPNIAARAVAQVRRLNRVWRSLHAASSNRLFFGVTDRFDDCGKISGRQMNRRLDLLCDYIEIPLDKQGRRWYVRSHQLRRFWAYSFFYKFGLGELHTIGWFLGHRESEQTWAYIRESFDGHDKEMRQIKAAYAASVLNGRHSASEKNNEAIASIQGIVLQHLGCSDLALVESDELQACLETIVEQGTLEIEPRFIRDENGSDYEILWIVRPKENRNA